LPNDLAGLIDLHSPKKIMKKFIALSVTTLAASAGFATFCPPSQAQVVVGPAADATAVDNTHFGAIVDLQCALLVASPSTGAAAGAGTITPYTAVTTNLGTDLDIDGAGAANELRVLSLTATETSTFNCNTDEIDLTVDLNVLSPAPDSFVNAVDFNYTTDATAGLMDHFVTLAVTRPNNDGGSGNAATENLGGFDGTQGANVTGQLFNSATFAGDDQANFRLAITSNFATTAEELGAGTYETVFVTTAVAQ
jgi:hypothetical protein